MRRPFFVLAATMVAVSAWPQEAPDNLVLVEGGIFQHRRSNYHDKGIVVASFYIGRHEVTQKEWMEVMGNNPSHFQGENLPVEMVSWYDCVEYCNRRSLQEGLQPYYQINKIIPDPDNGNDFDAIRWTVKIHAGANGYRLPSEAEWEYAAGGGRKSQSYTYSGGNEIDKVAWFWQNSGDIPLTGLWSWPAVEQNHNKTNPVGKKEPNELGLFDMSGNVREWCWDWYGDLESNGTAPLRSHGALGRVWKGGGWMGGDFCCEPSFRANYEANNQGNDQGFRVCRGT